MLPIGLFFLERESELFIFLLRRVGTRALASCAIEVANSSAKQQAAYEAKQAYVYKCANSHS
jgi:hypothetical protein